MTRKVSLHRRGQEWLGSAQRLRAQVVALRSVSAGSSFQDVVVLDPSLLPAGTDQCP